MQTPAKVDPITLAVLCDGLAGVTGLVASERRRPLLAASKCASPGFSAALCDARGRVVSLRVSGSPARGARLLADDRLVHSASPDTWEHEIPGDDDRSHGGL